jgi:polyhydroxybutyrate depolymerase
MAAIFLIMLLSGCGHRASMSTTTPEPTISSSTTPASTTHGDIVNTPIATTGCGKVSPIAAGSTADATIASNGLQRTYRLHIPVGYDPYRMTPLVLDIHGHDGTAALQENYSNYSALADQQHFLVVYPQGVVGPDGRTGWATYGKRDPTVNDVLFFSDLLTALQQQLCVDPHRIYATGISNGGGMTNLLACQMAGRIAAFVAVSAAIYPIPGGCHPGRPAPYMEFHGTSDPIVHYNGETALNFSPVMQTMQDWATRDGCASGPTTFFQQADVTGFKWTNCQGEVMVQHYRITGGGHSWPGATRPSPFGATTHTVSATTLGWQFFQRYQLPFHR